MLIDIMIKFFKLVSTFSRKIRYINELSNEFCFGHDNELKILDYINEVCIELGEELSLNIDYHSRIQVES
jgi:hypothetical protein